MYTSDGNSTLKGEQWESNGVKSKHSTLSLLACVQQPYREWIVFDESAAPPQHNCFMYQPTEAIARRTRLRMFNSTHLAGQNQ